MIHFLKFSLNKLIYKRISKGHLFTVNLCQFNMSTRILVICACIVLASANDIILLNDNTGKQVLDAKYEASPAIWKQEKNVTFQATNGEVINKIIVTDLRPEKDGVATIAAGGIGQDNVVIELQSPSILRGFDYRVQIFTIAPKTVRLTTTTTAASSIFSSFFAPQLVTIGLRANTADDKDGQYSRAQLGNVLRTNSNNIKSEKPDEHTSKAPSGSSLISNLELIIDEADLSKRNKHITQREDLNITTAMPRIVRDSETQNIVHTSVNPGIKNNNGSTNSEVRSDAKLPNSYSAGNVEEKDNTTEIPRNTRNTDSIIDNHTARTLENSKHPIATSSIRDKSTEQQRNVKRSKDDEDQNTPENSNVSTSTIKAYSNKVKPNDGEGFQDTEKPRHKRDTSTITKERQDLKNPWNTMNQNNTKQIEEPEKERSSTVSPSSLRRIGDPQDKFGEIGTKQSDEGLRKISTTQAPRSARNTEVKNIDTTAQPKSDTFNTEEQTDFKLRTVSQSNQENVNDVKKIHPNQAPRSVRDTEVKNIDSTTAKPKQENEEQTDSKLRTSLSSSTENNNGVNKISTTQAPGVLNTQLKNSAPTVKPTYSKPKVEVGVPFRGFSASTTEKIASKEYTPETLRISRDTVTETKKDNHTGKVNTTLRNLETTLDLKNSAYPNAGVTPTGDASKDFSLLSGLPGEDHKNQPITSGENSNTSPKPRNTRHASYYSSDTYHQVPHRSEINMAATTAKATILLETDLDMPMDYKQ